MNSFFPRIGWARLTLVLVLLAAAVCAPWVAPQNPYDLRQLNVLDARLSPGATSEFSGRHYWLGTDDQGRDLLSAILYGMRLSFAMGLGSTICGLLIDAPHPAELLRPHSSVSGGSIGGRYRLGSNVVVFRRRTSSQ